jgi:hypothetical protein
MADGRNCNTKWDREMIQLGKAAKVIILTSDDNLLAAQNIEIQPGRFATLLDHDNHPRVIMRSSTACTLHC